MKLEKGKRPFNSEQEKCQRIDNLFVIHITADVVDALLQRSMQLQCNVQEGVMYLSDDNDVQTITFTKMN